ncbi:MAG: hypothetical protein M3440_05330 [Chloroflexota bacterium]|nr:hypothetical protein [Chloroflexota bacterium]
MQVDVLRENDNYVESLQTATHSADFGLDNLPALLVKVINESRWQTRWSRPLKREVTFPSFAAFANERTPAGLGISVDMLKRMCRDNDEALTAIEKALGSHQGQRTDLHDIIMKVAPKEQGTSTEYALRKLHADAPELLKRVLAKELTPNAAMIEAGFRKRTITIKADPQSAAQTIARHFDRDQVGELIACLYDEIAERRP